MSTTNDPATEASAKVPEGVIIPPPDVKNTIIKTVDYSFRRGADFLDRMKNREQTNPLFGFLQDDNPYHAYYEWYTKEYTEGRKKEVSTSATSQQTGSTKNEPQKPDDFQFAFSMPPINALDLDVIKLTALYVAQNGHKFLTKLMHRESSNIQFEFLKSNHSLHSFFNQLVEQYEKLYELPKQLQQKLDEGIEDPHVVLRRAKNRAEYQAKVEEEARDDARKAEQEQIEFAQIDWHDFKVVQTIEFTNADYQSDLPVPLTLAQVQYASLEQKKKGIYMLEEAEPDFVPYNSAPVPQTAPAPAQESQPSRPSAPETQAQSQAQIPQGIKVKPRGTSRRDKIRKNEPNLFISPITNEPVPESQYNEHMRISQLDPRYKEFKAIEEQRRATSNLDVAGAEENLKRMHSAMTDSKDDANDLKRKKQDIGPSARR